MTTSRRSLVGTLFVLPLVCLLVQASPSGGVDDIDTAEVLARFDEVQASIRTLSAEFTETTRSALLKDTIVAKGKVPFAVHTDHGVATAHGTRFAASLADDQVRRVYLGHEFRR